MYVKFGDHSCLGFEISCRNQTDRQTPAKTLRPSAWITTLSYLRVALCTVIFCGDAAKSLSMSENVSLEKFISTLSVVQ